MARDDSDSFLVWAQFVARGHQGVIVEGLDTLTMEFSDTTGITSAVPVPGVAVLQGAVIALLACCRRRRV